MVVFIISIHQHDQHLHCSLHHHHHQVHLPCSSKLPAPCMTDLRQKVGNATTDDYHDIEIIMTSISSILQLVYPDPGQSLRVVLSPNSVRYHHDHYDHHDHHDHHVIIIFLMIARFEEEEEFRSSGWASNYEVRLWPKDNISRRSASSMRHHHHNHIITFHVAIIILMIMIIVDHHGGDQHLHPQWQGLAQHVGV